MSVEGGLILKGQRIILPKSLHAAALEQINYPYQDAEKYKLRAKAAVFWCGINHDIDEMAHYHSLRVYLQPSSHQMEYSNNLKQKT